MHWAFTSLMSGNTQDWMLQTLWCQSVRCVTIVHISHVAETFLTFNRKYRFRVVSLNFTLIGSYATLARMKFLVGHWGGQKAYFWFVKPSYSLFQGLPNDGAIECADSYKHMSVMVVLNYVELLVDLMRFPGQLIPRTTRAILWDGFLHYFLLTFLNRQVFHIDGDSFWRENMISFCCDILLAWDDNWIVLKLLSWQCDDETCKHTTRRLNLRLMGDSEMGTICPYFLSLFSYCWLLLALCFYSSSNFGS